MPESEAKKAEAVTSEAVTYSPDRLIAEAQSRFGVGSHVAAGALSGLQKDELTADEAKSAIDKWQKKEIEVDNPLPEPAGEEG